MEESTISNNKRIAKNTLMLYIRMFFTMIVGFFTSRIVLQALGVNDYGIFNLVGGIVVLINVITSSLSMTTSRFLSFHMGSVGKEELRETFSVAFIIHAVFALLVLILGETAGLWFVNNQLVIDSNRFVAANYAYQAALFSTVLGIIQVPYLSNIIAHEKMGTFSYIEILSTSLKLIIALTVLYTDFDNLILYSVLYAALSVSIMSVYRTYCVYKFRESHLMWVWNKALAVKMLSFSGWSLYANANDTICKQSINIILNRFFGTAINAAAGLALQVQAILYGFIGNISMAFNPQIVKEYAMGNYKRVNELICMGAKLSSTLTLIVSVPVIVNMKFLMELWLVEVPDHVVPICQILLIYNFVNSFNPMIVFAINATGKVKWMCGFSGTLSLFNILAGYFILLFTESAPLVFWIFPCSTFLICMFNIFLINRLMPAFDVREFSLRTLFPSVGIGSLSICVCELLKRFIVNGFISFVATVIVSVLVIAVSVYVFVLDTHSRNYINSKVRFKFSHG